MKYTNHRRKKYSNELETWNRSRIFARRMECVRYRKTRSSPPRRDDLIVVQFDFSNTTADLSLRPRRVSGIGLENGRLIPSRECFSSREDGRTFKEMLDCVSIVGRKMRGEGWKDKKTRQSVMDLELVAFLEYLVLSLLDKFIRKNYFPAIGKFSLFVPVEYQSNARFRNSFVYRNYSQCRG